MRYGRDTSREYATEEREKRRAFQTETAATLAETGMAETERKQTGETRRATMKIEADRLTAERKADVDRQAALAKVGTEGTTKAKGGITADQMAKHRTGALEKSQERLESLRNPITNKTKHPATGEDMTPAQESEYVKFEADNLLKYSLGGGKAVAGEEATPEDQGWLETEGGRRFEIGGERGFTETTPERAPMAPAGARRPDDEVLTEEAAALAATPPPVTDATTITPRPKVGGSGTREALYAKQPRYGSMGSTLGSSLSSGIAGVSKFLKRRGEIKMPTARSYEQIFSRPYGGR